VFGADLKIVIISLQNIKAMV